MTEARALKGEERVDDGIEGFSLMRPLKGSLLLAVSL